MDFREVIRNGGFAIPHDSVKIYIEQHTTPAQFAEIKELNNDIAVNHTPQRAEIFLRTVAAHIMTKDWDNYRIIMNKYRSWIDEYKKSKKACN